MATLDARGVLRSGDPRAALEKLKQDVRKAPRDPKLRTFLFQLFCITGEWDRAINQLSVISEIDKLAMPMVATYRAAIRCEILRERVFAGTRQPDFFGEPEPWMSLLVEANRRLAAGAFGHAAELRDQAFEAAPSSSGTADGTAFEWIADADPRLGPVLEAVIDGKYYWLPVHRLAKLEIDPPEDLRDQVWLPAQLTFANGGGSVALLPARYPGTQDAADPALLLGRRTEWVEQGEGWFLGLGQRMLTIGAEEDLPLLDLRRLEIAAPPAAEAEARPAAG
ncbi:type VI secretion system accessory protein TagJ [Siccirubricoccus phaeus]|uniref:type VI secretion system accessory protein TagJ n=1 Tax=Siccirubricoccus phaeus TaxID=2595053 RepID=UPI0011F2A5C6|nr:type VI secretion system accessory protein TagJ [Siccirubricoccus phaeus]